MRAGDHPHTRGDHDHRACSHGWSAGSSPHAWGPPCATRPEISWTGIIPTRVGTTSERRGSLKAPWDHPHTRGDHYPNMAPSTCLPGSSPHAWGPPRACGCRRKVAGIIPTRVGTTACCPASGGTWRDHPHTRGDHDPSISIEKPWLGSSPHAWGPPQKLLEPDFQLGIIPTRVGTTLVGIAALARALDHPHTRGDHPASDMAWANHEGSSPHAWGPRDGVAGVERAHGIIPTRVGTTLHGIQQVPSAGDHPHTRGDHAAVGALSNTWQGSSPHAWGPQFSTCYLTTRLAVSASLCHKKALLLAKAPPPNTLALRTTYPNFRLLRRLLALLQPF